MSGRLVLCATPIGNLEDITQRALRLLREADVVACEDARRTRKLLTHFSIPARSLVVYNEGNERRKARKLVEIIARGRTVVLVSDAGMPGLSDPGYHLVRECIDRSLPVEVAPGPTAAVSALAVSGLPPARFVFEGFLARRPGDRRRRIEELAGEQRTIVLYESPHRLADCLTALLEVLGDRRAVVARELTKLHEQVVRGRLSELVRWASQEPVRGEMVVVVEGAVGPSRPRPDDRELARRARALMAEGVDRKEAMARVATGAGVARRAIFDALVAVRDDAGEEEE